MKNLVLISLAIFSIYTSTAQRVAVRWNEKYKAPEGLFLKSQFIKMVPTSEEVVIGIFRKKNTSLFDNDYSLIKMNTKLDNTGEIKLDYPANGSEGLIDVLKLNKTNFLLEYKINLNQIAELSLTPINLKTFKKEISSKKIGEINDADHSILENGNSRMYSITMEAQYSPDSSKVLMNYEFKYQEGRSVQVMVLTNGGNLLYTSNYTWTEQADHLQINKPAIDNDGKVYFSYHHYSKSFDKEFEKGDGEAIPTYTSHLLVVDKENKSNQTIEPNGKFLYDMVLGYSKDQKPLIMGTYQDKFNGRINGVFISPVIGSGTSLTDLAFTPYPADLQEKIEFDMELKKSKPGFTHAFSASRGFSANGTNFLVGEFNDRLLLENAIRIIKGDFIVTTFKSDGKAQFQSLPRSQNFAVGRNSNILTNANTFTGTLLADKLLVFYNDYEENAMQEFKEKPIKFEKDSKSVLMAAVISSEGKLLSRKNVFNHQDLEGYIFNFKLCPMKTSTFAVYATEPENEKEGMLAGMLLVK